MSAILRGIEKLTGAGGIVAGLIIVPLIFATVYEVLARYLFNAPTIWAFEIGYMAMGANYLLGAAYTLREGAHIRIDVAYTHFRPKTKAVVDVFAYAVLFLPLGIWLSYSLGQYAWKAYESGETSGQSAWNPVIWPFRVVFLVGIVLLTLQAIVELVKAIRVLLGDDAPDHDGSPRQDGAQR